MKSIDQLLQQDKEGYSFFSSLYSMIKLNACKSKYIIKKEAD